MTIPHSFNNIIGLKTTPGSGGVTGTAINDDGATVTMNESPSIGLEGISSQVRDGGVPCISTVRISMKFLKDATNGVVIQVKDNGTGGNGDLVSIEGVQRIFSPNSFSVGTTFETVYDLNGFDLTHLKMKQTTEIYPGYEPLYTTNEMTYLNSYTDDTWLAVNTNDFIELESRLTLAVAGGDSDSSYKLSTVEFWGRAAGYDDTKLFTMEVRSDCDSSSSQSGPIK